MKNILLTLLYTLPTLAFSQNDQPEREAFRLEVAIDSVNFYGMDVPKSPYFPKEKILQIYPGESLNIEAEIKGDSIYAMKVVRKMTDPKNTIVVRFSPSTPENVEDQMMLIVTNPFAKTLIHDAAMFTFNRNDWQSTSIIPIQPGLTNYEMWHDKILTIALYNWRFVD